MKRYWLSLIASLVLAALALYAAAFFAWITATSITPADLERARFGFGAWTAVFAVSALACIAPVARISMLLRRRTRGAEREHAA